MELIWLTPLAAALGLLVRYLLPKHDSYGLLLLPFLSAAVAAAVWAILVWAGWKTGEPWMWLVALLVAGLAALAGAIALPRVRAASDARLMHTLSRGRA